MSKFIHQIFYSNNKFDNPNYDAVYADLQKWAFPDSIHIPDSKAVVVAPSTPPKEEVPVSPPVYSPQLSRATRWSIFQCMYILYYGYSDYLLVGNRIANKELEEKQKIMETLSKTPKKIKEANQKLTNDNVQEILSGLFVSTAKDEIMLLIAYSMFYNKIIFLVFQHSYLIFAPTKDAVITETHIQNRDVYVVYQTRKHPKYGGSYYPELDLTLEMVDTIRKTKIYLEHYAKPFKGISTYKVDELESMARLIGILEIPDKKPAKTTKRELYDKIVEKCCEGICWV